MIDKISEIDLIIFETLTNPIAFSEILFDEYENLSHFDTEKCGKVRLYQYNFFGFDSMLYEDENLSKKEIFNQKKGMSECYVLGGRLTGKSLCSLILDCVISIFHKTFKWGVVSSYDEDHVKNVMERIVIALENHPILKLLETYKNTQRKPYHVLANNGCLLESVNDNLVGKNPGAHWLSKHVDKNWIEEASFMTKNVTNKRFMAVSELGCIDRMSGMTTFSKVSPMGEIFYNMKNKNKIVNLPSYVNPTWDSVKKEAAIIEFGGENSQGYLVQIRGEVVENGDCVYDIERIRDTYIRDKQGTPIPIKSFEINKNNFYNYKDILILDRPNNAEKLILSLDVGEGGAPTEIIVLSQTNGIYEYIYNITTFKISPDEEKELVKYIIILLTANIVGIDITSGGGKALFSSLAKDFNKPKEETHIFGVSFNEKIDIDFEKEDNGDIKRDNNGHAVYKQEYIVDWSIQRLKHIFYNQKIKCYVDMKMDAQFDGIVVMQSKQRTVYGSKIANHLHQAFQVFAIVDWQTEFKNIVPVQKLKKSFGAFGSI